MKLRTSGPGAGRQRTPLPGKRWDDFPALAAVTFPPPPPRPPSPAPPVVPEPVAREEGPAAGIGECSWSWLRKSCMSGMVAPALQSMADCHCRTAVQLCGLGRMCNLSSCNLSSVHDCQGAAQQEAGPGAELGLSLWGGWGEGRERVLLPAMNVAWTLGEKHECSACSTPHVPTVSLRSCSIDRVVRPTFYKTMLRHTLF